MTFLKNSSLLSFTLSSFFISSVLIAKVSAMDFPPASVNVVTAKIVTLTPLVSVSGTTVSQNDSKIAAEVSGRLVDLSPIGARVNKGDILAKIDDKHLKIQYREQQASLLNAQTQLNFLETEVTRKTALVSKKLSPRTELDKTVSERDVAKGEVLAAQARLDRTTQNLDYTEVKAPFSGIVAARIANLGEYIDSGNAIVRLVETANTEASVFTPIVAYQFLTQSKELLVESPLGQGYAPIKTVIPVADSRSHLMEVRLDMSGFNWPIGLNFKTKVASGPSKEALTVPRDALVLRREGISIFRINKDNTAEKIRVTVGMAMDELVEVIGGVKAGDLIVIRGAERLSTGQAVQIKDNNQALISGSTAAKANK
ncbi:MAG: efflux RND transporter periplasmic adaptor subunit [Colwellia sp.]|nr:efflux RND transporter periplasmic adaptor subunit [Colwellia sp.]